MNITIGSDHGAVALKDEVKMVLKEYEDIKVTDVGTFGTESVDYPDIAEKVCADVTSGKADLGIVLCGTGIGISIAANKVKGIRACCSPTASAASTPAATTMPTPCAWAAALSAPALPASWWISS